MFENGGNIFGNKKEVWKMKVRLTLSMIAVLILATVAPAGKGQKPVFLSAPYLQNVQLSATL